MERQSTSKLFKIVIAIVAFFVLCSSALLFASCGVSKDDGHEHVYPETPNATVPATCGTPGYIVYECTECGEQFKVEISLATGKHTFDENDVCTKCGMTKTQADLLTQAAFKSAIDDLKNTLGTLATGAQLQGLNDLSQAQVKTLTDALETALKAAITNAQTAITEAVGGSTSAGSAGTDSAKEAILQAIQEALKAINGEDATSVQSVLKAEIAKQTAKIEEYNTDLKNLKTALEAAQGEAKDAIIEKINKTNEAIESAKDAIVAAVSVAQTSIEGKLDDLDEKVGTAQTTLSGEIGNVKTVVDGIQEALKALNDLAKTTDVKEVKTLVEEFQGTLTTTLTEKFGSIDSEIKALTNSESGIAASVNKNTDAKLEALKEDLEALIKTQTSDSKFDKVVTEIEGKIAEAFSSFEQTMNDALAKKLEGILTQSHFDTELQKVTETLGKIESKVNENLDKKLSEVESKIGTAQTAILAAIEKMASGGQEGEGPVLPTIKGWVQDILYAITGDPQYAPEDAASLMSETTKPAGMQNQISDLWVKAVELQDALATLSGSLTTLSDSVSNLPNKTEVQGYITALQEELKGKQDTYNTNLKTLNDTLSSVSTKVDNVQSYLEETLYKQLEAMDDKLTTLVQNMGEFYKLFTKLRTYAQEHYADLGVGGWDELFTSVLENYGAYFQKLPDYLDKLKGWDDLIEQIIEFAKKEGIVNEAGGLEVGNFTKAVDTLKYVYDFLGVGDALDKDGRYAQKTVTTLAALVDLLNKIESNTDGLKGMVSDLADQFATQFDGIDNETLKAALNALTTNDKSANSLSGLADALAQLQETLDGIPVEVLDKEGVKQAISDLINDPSTQTALIEKLKGLIKTYTGMEAGDLKALVNTYLQYANQLKDIFGDGHGIEQLKALADWAFEERHNLKDLVEAGTSLKELASNQDVIVEAATQWNKFLKSQDLADIIAAAGAINDETSGIKALAGLIGDLNGAVEGLPNSEAIVDAFKAALDDLTIESKVDTSEVVKDLKEEIKTLLNMVLPEEYQNNWAGLASLAQDFVELVIDLKESIFTDDHGVEQLAQLADWAFENRGNIKALVANADGFVDLVDGKTGVLAQLEKVFSGDGFGKVDELSDKLGKFTAESTLKNYLDKVFGGNSAAGAHQHHWVKRLAEEADGALQVAENQTPNCLTSNTYVWSCNICGELETKDGQVITEKVLPTGHVLDWERGLTDGNHHVAATCVDSGSVEAYCVVCNQYIGQWTDVKSEPATGKHVWVKETTENQTGEHNTCTGIHSYVMHCVTCGGAYTEQVNTPGSMGPDGKVTYHDYYSALDVNGKPNGTKLTDEEKEALYRTYAEVNDIEPDGDGKYEDVLTPQQKYEALEAYLNKVWDSPATCVEPALTVVECVDCGVRYAYANGTPKGHDFKLHLGQDATCTMDGNKSYAFCPDCGYYFEIPETDKVSTLSFTAPTLSEGKYYYAGQEITKDLANWLNNSAYSKDYAPKGGTAFKGADNEAAHAYFANGNEATGHKYVVVYTNIPNCVTAQTYMLVCTTCFKAKVGGKGFNELLEKEGESTVDDALFYQDKDGKYWVKDLSGSETGGIDAAADQEKVGAIIGEADPADSDLGKQVAKYVKDAEDANADANVKAEAKAKLVEWILKYGVRDGGNKWTAEELSAMDVAALEDLIDTEIGENYKSNVVKDASFVLPVKGHTFNDVVTTVVGVCVMYPRHQFFCSVCGQGAVDPSFTTSAGDTEVPKLGNAKVPYFVTGTADAEMAYAVSEGKVTDLQQEWNKISAEGAEVDDVLNWLGQYGYLNDFRENIATPWNKTELETVKANLGKHYGKDSENPATVTLANINEWKLFTGKNVLGEYIEKVNAKGEEIVLGHKFDLAIQLDAGSCNEPGAYVYVCSVCGMKSAWEFGDKSNHSAIKQPSWWVGAEEPDTYIEYEMGDATVKTNVRLLEAHDKNEQWGPSWNYYYLFDSALDGSNGQMNANIPTGRTDIDKSDLVKSWEAAQAGTENGDAIFEWLLEHGYLNNVIDTVIEMARADLADANNYNITQQAAGEAAWENYYEYTAQNIYDLAYAWWKGTETITLVDEGEPVNVLDTMAKIFNATGETEIEANDLQLDEEKQKAILQLVLVGGPVENTQDGTVEGILGEDADLSVFYTKQGSGQEYGYAAQTSNSTYVGAATPIPVSGHVYLKGDGYRYDKHNDPRCKDFASDELTEHYKNNELVYWVSEATEKEPHKGHWEVCGTFDPNNLDPTFKAQADEFGILAACKRQNCPFHAEYNAEQYGEGKEQYTAGYVAAEPHNMVMEKWAADSETGYPLRADQAGKFEGSVEKTRVQYKRGYESYLGLAEDGRKIVTEVKDVNGEVKATAEQIAAAQAKMDKDLYNLNTLQAIWNGLFIGDEYINSHKLESGELPYYGKVFTLEDLKENGVITEATLAALAKALNDEEIPLLWNEDHGKIVSAWRPLNDEGAPSCWIINRCEWYQYERKDVEGEFVENYNGTMCTMSLGNNAHDWPYEGEFDFETHTANCQHVDLCNTCGEPIGTKGDHKLRRVSSDEDNALLDPALQDAWLAILNHLKFDEPDENLAWLKGLVEMEDKDKSGKIDKWDEWTVLGDTCYKHVDDDEGKTEGEENGHEIYICIGELEVIYETVKTLDKSFETVYTADNASGKPIAWLLAEEKDIKVDGSCANANYFVKTIDEIPHEYVTRYYSDEACTQVILNKDGEPATTLVEVGSSDKQYVCQVGFWEEKCCINEKRDGEPCDCREPDSKIYHAPIGHVVAPIKNYDSREYQDADKYSPATEARNAVIDQVCVYCGSTFHTEWTKAKPEDGSDRDMYKLASPAEMDAWNEYNTNDSNDVEPFKPKDWKTEPGKTGNVSASAWNHNANFTYPEDSELTLEADKNQFRIGSNLNPQVTIGKDATLTLKGTESDVGLDIWGAKLTVKGEDKNTSVLDLSELGKGDQQAIVIEQVGSELTLENLTVKLGSTPNSVIFPKGSRYGGSKVIVKDCIIVKEGGGAPIQTSQNSRGMCRDVEIVITDSVIVSKDDAALFINEGGTSNLPAKVTAENSKFYGKNIGVVIRGGDAKFTNCTFATEAGQSYSGGSWSDGTNIPVSAGIVVGTKDPVAAYGNANVTLNKCAFQLGTYSDFATENEIQTVAMTPEFSGTDYSIALFGNETNHATLTLDAATAIVAQNMYKDAASGDNATLNVPDASKEDLGATPEIQAQNAAKLVENLVAAGGSVTLPKIDEEIAVKGAFGVDQPGFFNTAKDAVTDIDLGGNTLAVDGNGSMIKGTLTLKNGTLQTPQEGGAQVTFAVEGKLELVDMHMTFDNGSILPVGENAEISITGGVFIGKSVYATLINTNNVETKTCTITLKKAVFISELSSAVLINTENVTLTAEDCQFFGIDTAVWVRAGNATFTNCTFISGGWRVAQDAWGEGTKMSRQAYAALAVGEGVGTTYGKAIVTVNGESTEVVRGWVLRADNSAYTSPSTVTWDENGFTATGEAKESALAKRFSVACNTNPVTVTFGSETIAQKFLAETKIFNANAETTSDVVIGLVKDKTIFYPATGNLITVNYNEGEETKEVLPTFTLSEQEVAEKAPEVLTEVAKNGGKVVLPEGEEEIKISDEALTVADEVDVEIDLNGHQLSLEKGSEVSGNLTIKGGDVVVTKMDDSNFGIHADGEDANVTLSGVQVSVEDRDTKYAIYGSFGATIIISDSVFYVQNGAAIGTNQTKGPAKIVLIDSLFVSEVVLNQGKSLTSIALLINQADTEVYAGGCTFYGESTGAWIRAAKKAVFAGCTFIYGGSTGPDSQWTSGTGLPDAAKSALVIGDLGSNLGKTVYGDVDVELSDCTLKSIDLDGQDNNDDTDNFEDETKAKFEEKAAGTVYTYVEDEDGNGSLTKGDAGENTSWQLTFTEGNGTDKEEKKIMIACATQIKITIKISGLDTLGLKDLGEGVYFKVGVNVFDGSSIDAEHLTITDENGEAITVAAKD